MLDAEERFYLWDNYKDKFDALFTAVEEDCYKYAPYEKKQDKDAPILLQFFELLKKMSAFIDAHHKELYRDFCNDNWARINLQCAFDAWQLGLCYKAVGNMTHGALQSIATFKTSREISRQDTERALNLWREYNNIKVSA